jgi:hypothetical protein
VFILVADGRRGTLVLPREDRVLRDAPPEQIVEALAGVPLGPDALRTVVSGCGCPSGTPADGATFANGWTAVSLPDGTAYLRRNAAPGSRGRRQRPVTVTYADYVSAAPRPSACAPDRRGPSCRLTLRL